MNSKTILTIFWLYLCCLRLAQAEEGKSLRDAYAASLKRSEVIGIQNEMLVQAVEQESQAKAAFFPNINGTGTFLTQAQPSNATGNALYPSTQNTLKVTATQPLFQGFRDFATLRQRNNLVGTQVYLLQSAARQLFYDLSTAYYNVLAYHQDEENYRLEIQINLKRLRELQAFFKIGRSQLTDLLTFKANIASLESQLENTRGQLETAKDILAYLTGWGRDTVVQDSVKDKGQIPFRADVNFYLLQIEKRADVQTAVYNLKANEENIPIARGGHLPSVNLLGDYYFTRPGIALVDVNWDVQISLTIPIFQGGAVQSQVRQAESLAEQYRLTLSQTRRTAEQEIRTFYDAVIADIKQVSKLTELLDISKKNYETEIQYYKNGLVTNLDVLQAITTYQDAKRQLDRQRLSLNLDTVKLQAATGQRVEVNIKPKVNL